MRYFAVSAAAATMLASGPALADEVLVPSQGANELRADWVLGATVTSLDGERIGSIEDLILDQTDGTVNAAVISVGGFLGFGAKDIAVDWTQLQIDWDGAEITLDLTREAADEAAEYTFRDRDTPEPEMPDDPGMANGMGAPAPAPAPE